jgi:hypothetical protein
MSRVPPLKLKKILSITLILVVSVNFLLFSSKSYSPPRAESISYSIVNCPTHEGEHHQTNVINIFLGADDQHGSEKDCFCYDCCSQRISPDIISQTFFIILEKYSTTLEIFDESVHIEDAYKNLPIRSPPYPAA